MIMESLTALCLEMPAADIESVLCCWPPLIYHSENAWSVCMLWWLHVANSMSSTIGLLRGKYRVIGPCLYSGPFWRTPWGSICGAKQGPPLIVNYHLKKEIFPRERHVELDDSRWHQCLQSAAIDCCNCEKKQTSVTKKWAAWPPRHIS